MDVVPDHWSSFEDGADVFQGLNGDLLADHLATCAQEAIMHRLKRSRLQSPRQANVKAFVDRQLDKLILHASPNICQKEEECKQFSFTSISLHPFSFIDNMHANKYQMCKLKVAGKEKSSGKPDKPFTNLTRSKSSPEVDALPPHCMNLHGNSSCKVFDMDKWPLVIIFSCE